MISGTIYNAGKLLEMTHKWEQKKSSGNLLKKEDKELSPEEQQLKLYQEQFEKDQEGKEYSTIYAKIQSGQKLTPTEEDKLRTKDPKVYMEYKADRMEQEAYEKKLKNCKTKEEAERLHVNRMNGKLSELKSIVNNPNIPKSEKLKEAQRILGDTTKTAMVFHTFITSTEFKELPTEEEVTEATQVKAAPEEKDFLNENDEMADVSENCDNKSESASDALQTEKKILQEMFTLEKNHFGEFTQTVRIDTVL